MIFFLPVRKYLSASTIAVASLCLSASVRAEVPVSVEAADLFAQGVEALKSAEPGTARLAYSSFKAAYADSPSWRILGNIGLAAFQLERFGEAQHAFREYLSRGDGSLAESEVDFILNAQNRIGFHHGTIKIEVPGGLPFVVVDDRMGEPSEQPVHNEYGPFDSLDDTAVLVVNSGNHQLRIVSEGFQDAVWNVVVEPGSTVTRRFELAEQVEIVDREPEGELIEGQTLPPDGPQWRTLTYWTFGGAGVSLGAATVLLLQARGVHATEKSRFANVCGGVVDLNNPACAAINSGDRNAATWMTWAGVGFGVASVSLAAAASLYFLDTPVVVGEDSYGAADALSIRAWVGPWAVGVRGKF